jgi:dTDP-4-amino-4,6-dideoxygalactose transaminase
MMTGIPVIEGGTPVRETFLPFSLPSISEEEIADVADTLRSGWLTTGPKVQRFEEDFARFIGSANAVAVNSCTAALHLSLLGVGVGPGDEVIVPDLTFVATVNSVIHTGATPVVADVDPLTWNITAEEIERRITDRTRAVVVVHFAGLPCELDAIYALADDRGIRVIEDCAHAVGAEYRGVPIGATPGPCAFSFYANKNMTTMEGGMLTTSDQELADKARVWRLHGLDRDAWRRFEGAELILSRCGYPGFKYNLTDVAAALGIGQLRRLPMMLERREVLASLYDDGLRTVEGVSTQTRPTSRDVGRHALHLYAVTVDIDAHAMSRDHLLAALRAENIGAALHYEPIHTQPYYARTLGASDQDLPVASRVGSSILSLPLFPDMEDGDVADTLEALGKVLAYYRRP